MCSLEFANGGNFRRLPHHFPQFTQAVVAFLIVAQPIIDGVLKLNRAACCSGYEQKEKHFK